MTIAHAEEYWGKHCHARANIVEKMATVPSEIYPHIYSFLLQNKFVKTAKSFKKESLVVSTLSCLVFSLTLNLTLVNAPLSNVCDTHMHYYKDRKLEVRLFVQMVEYQCSCFVLRMTHRLRKKAAAAT